MLNRIIDYFINIYRPIITLNIIKGRIHFPKIVNMYERSNIDKGVINIKGKLYYLIGVYEKEAYERSTGKMATGAVIGGILIGGVGAVVGGVLGSGKSNKPTFIFELADYKTKEVITIHVKIKKSDFKKFIKFKMVHPADIGIK